MIKKIEPNTFDFNNKNSWKEFGIKVVSHDPFSAAKRARGLTIPFRHGEYDYGDKYYNIKTLSLECYVDRPLSKGEMREVIYWLSERGQLFFWDEPDKYYIGELLDSADVTVLTSHEFHNFTINMQCEPFAYGELITIPLTEGRINVNYLGTAPTPTLIILKNDNSYAVNGLSVTVAVSRRF